MVRIARILTSFSPIPWAKRLALPPEANSARAGATTSGEGVGADYLLEYLVNSRVWDQPPLFLSLTTPPCALSLLGKCRGPGALSLEAKAQGVGETFLPEPARRIAQSRKLERNGI